MFSAEAMRLAAIEVVTPFAAITAGSGFPTLAGKRAYDSRAASVGDLDEKLPYTPVLSFFTANARATLRGDAAEIDDQECEGVLEVVAELAVNATDNDGVFADALAGDDPEARLVLAALVAQVIFLLCYSEAGYLFRQSILNIRKIEEEPFALPQLGLRWQRTTIRLTCGLPADRFDIDQGGLPEPVKSLAASLPAGSYARTKLDELAAHFAADPRPALEMVTLSPAVGQEPIASVDFE